MRRLRRLRNRLLMLEVWSTYEFDRVRRSRLRWGYRRYSDTTTRFVLTPLGLLNQQLGRFGWSLYLYAELEGQAVWDATLHAERVARSRPR